MSETKYDLEERTGKFGEDIIGLCQTIRLSVIISPIISQLIRSATSIGANYMEANSASSKKDFKNKIYICKKRSSRNSALAENATKSCPRKRKIHNRIDGQV